MKSSQTSRDEVLSLGPEHPEHLAEMNHEWVRREVADGVGEPGPGG